MASLLSSDDARGDQFAASKVNKNDVGIFRKNNPTNSFVITHSIQTDHSNLLTFALLTPPFLEDPLCLNPALGRVKVFVTESCQLKLESGCDDALRSAEVKVEEPTSQQQFVLRKPTC